MKIRQIIISAAVFMLSVAAYAQKAELTGVLAYNNQKYICAHIEPEGKTVQGMTLTTYNMTNGQSTSRTDYTEFGSGYYLFYILTLNTTPYAYSVTVTFTDGTQVKTSTMEENGLERFDWLGSEVAWSEATSGWAEHPAVADKGMDNNRPFTVNETGYYKGISTHGEGKFVFVFPENTPYTRFYTQYGIQDNCKNGDFNFTFTVNGEEKLKQLMYAKSNTAAGATGPYVSEFACEINGATNIVLGGDLFDNNNSGDHMNYPMARVYYKTDTRQQQVLEWQEEKILESARPFAYTLDAKSKSEGEIIYRIVSGAEFATIENGVLNITTIPEDKEQYIEVEAFQPGTAEYRPTDLYRCKYYVRNEKTVQKGEKLIITENDDIDQITVYGDAQSVGQVIVENGIVKVNKLVLKYTFVPGKWNFITFPGEFDLDKISDLNSKGYYLNQSPKAYYLCEYDTKTRAQEPGKSAWKRMEMPVVKKNKGYIMGVARTQDENGTEPVEITFTLDNATLGTTIDQNGSLNVALDLIQIEPETEFPVYVSAEGVKSNKLKVMVKFQPGDLSELPLDFGKALDQARITFNPNRSGIRLTLPESTPAKVLIFDRSGKMVKAVKYVSPHLIDITDLKKGEYTLLVEYGHAQSFKEFEIK